MIDDDCLATLRTMGIETLKHNWQCLLVSWRVEEKGLGYDALNNFLAYWQMELNSSADQDPVCVAPRPEWIERFDPDQVSQDILAMSNKEALQVPEPTQTPSLVAGASSSHLPPPADNKPDESTKALKDIQVHLSRFDEKAMPLAFLSDILPTNQIRDRLLQFDTGRANDEIVNMFGSILNSSARPGGNDHVGQLFGLAEPPDETYRVLSSFFLPFLEQLMKKRGGFDITEDDGKAILKWFKPARISALQRILIPANHPPGVHWFLVVIRFADRKLCIYDSWKANRDACGRAGTAVQTLPYASVLMLILPVINVLHDASGEKC
ncbi:hypothetical protein FB45DRAFT_562525 [Roridomyces roridus]|uniref:Ubiquitin-like protease family profile domain-containing protein n=1 Tax=Roridomyces roridus TaxID=1738132 RepID=A0AAD7AZ22_9AGAR|nr:hypothetical protein FB45DRAFT_562525 [Roridomyces roridus]